MSTPVPSTRRLAIAIGAAATSATVAIGVTAASLLGWFSPSPGSPTSDRVSEAAAPAPVPAVTPASPVILVPVAPTPERQPVTDSVDDVQLAVNDTGDDDDHERREHRRDHEDEEEGDDDD